MKFDPEKYDTVDSRIQKFYDDHPDGAITTDLLSDPNNIDVAVVKAFIWLQQGEKLVATGLAIEIRDKEMKTSNYGKQYESVNYTAWLENAETSAIGRGLANYGYSGAKRPSREEMDKVERMTEKPEMPKEDEPVAFQIIVKAANDKLFGDKTIEIMTQAAAAKQSGDYDKLDEMVKELELADDRR